jgi:hypothetical protein
MIAAAFGPGSSGVINWGSSCARVSKAGIRISPVFEQGTVTTGVKPLDGEISR